MGLQRISIQTALAQWADFDAVIDARSESEFAEDRLPQAVNWPSLSDEERHLVGTQYKQVSAFEARKQGAVLVARNIARHIEREVLALPKSWKSLIYCWRGGQRSGSLALILSQIGFDVTVLEGGYKAFRQHIVQWIPEAGADLPLVVLCGRTGTSKTRLLRTLSAQGAQVLDLEGLASHRGSILGAEPDRLQPSQKAFEHALWAAIGQLDRHRPVFVESESRTIGRLRLPESLILRMHASPCIHLDMPLEARVAFLCEDYAHLVRETSVLAKRLDALRIHRGHDTVDGWQLALQQGHTADVVRDLLVQHYDPIYLRSMNHHFSQLASAHDVTLPDGRPETLAACAQQLLSQTIWPELLSPSHIANPTISTGTPPP